jgi:hypothetical protein
VVKVAPCCFSTDVEKKNLARGKFKSTHFLIIDIALSNCGDELRILKFLNISLETKG